MSVFVRNDKAKMPDQFDWYLEAVFSKMEPRTIETGIAALRRLHEHHG